MKKQWNCRTPDSISYTERYRVYPHTLKWETTYHHVLVSIANLTFQFKRPLWIHNKKLSVCDKSSVDSSNRPQQMPITSYTFNFNIDQVFHSLSQDSTVTVNWTLLYQVYKNLLNAYVYIVVFLEDPSWVISLFYVPLLTLWVLGNNTKMILFR